MKIFYDTAKYWTGNPRVAVLNEKADGTGRQRTLHHPVDDPNVHLLIQKNVLKDYPYARTYPESLEPNGLNLEYVGHLVD